jgi:hypothetical protein
MIPADCAIIWKTQGVVLFVIPMKMGIYVYGQEMLEFPGGFPPARE